MVPLNIVNSCFESVEKNCLSFLNETSIRPKCGICGSGFPIYPIVPTLLKNIYLLLAAKYLKIGTFSDFDAIFFCKMF